MNRREWDCPGCERRGVPDTERVVSIGGSRVIKLACPDCGYPDLAQIVGGACS